MKVVIIDHARERMQERGAAEAEVLAVLERGSPVDVSAGRKAKEMVFSFHAEWQGRFYQQKKVRVIYAEEDDSMAVITVYTYFGRWEEEA